MERPGNVQRGIKYKACSSVHCYDRVMNKG